MQERLGACILGRPGATVADLARALGVHRVLVARHLCRLAREGRVTVVHGARVRMHFAAERPPPPDAAWALECLRDPTRRGIAEAVRAGGVVTQADLVRATGRSQRLVAYHLQRLARAGLVDVSGRRPKTFRPAPRLDAALFA